MTGEPANGGYEHGRDPGGRFQRGRSGNPRGRPRGSRNRATLALDALGEAHAEAILRRLIGQAEAGDVAAAESILRRCWPVPRGRRIAVRLPDVSTPEGAQRAAVALVREVAAGAITAEDASAVLALIEGAARLGALQDLEARLAALEAARGAAP
jgi:thioredoxin-like negative regulator of GroEL